MDDVAPDEPLNDNQVLETLDRLERMLARITGPAEATGGPPAQALALSKHATRRKEGLTHLYRDPRNGIIVWRRSDELRSEEER